MDKTQKAKARLKEFESFSPDFETFESLFWENLDKSQSDVAINLLLQVVFDCLKSEGEKFNEVIDLVDENKAKELKSWIENTRSKL